MDTDFKKFFSSTMGIITAVLIMLAGVCLCCMFFYAIGLSQEQSSLTYPTAAYRSFGYFALTGLALGGQYDECTCERLADR